MTCPKKKNSDYDTNQYGKSGGSVTFILKEKVDNSKFVNYFENWNFCK